MQNVHITAKHTGAAPWCCANIPQFCAELILVHGHTASRRGFLNEQATKALQPMPAGFCERICSKNTLAIGHGFVCPGSSAEYGKDP